MEKAHTDGVRQSNSVHELKCNLMLLSSNYITLLDILTDLESRLNTFDNLSLWNRMVICLLNGFRFGTYKKFEIARELKYSYSERLTKKLLEGLIPLPQHPRGSETE